MSDTGRGGGWLRGLFRRKREPEEDTPLFPPMRFAAPSPEAMLPGQLDPDPEAPAPFVPRAPDLPAEPAASPPFACYQALSLDGRFLSLGENATAPSLLRQRDAAFGVFLIVASAQPHLCLILAQDGRPLAIPGDTLGGVASSARIMRSAQADVVRLRLPLGGARFLVVTEPPAGEPAAGAVRFDGHGNSLKAAWQLAPADIADLSLGLRSLALEFAAAVNAGLRQDQLVDRLREGALRPALAEPVLRLLPRDELADLARRLLDEKPVRAAVQAAIPADRFLARALPVLAEWRVTRGPLSADGQADSPENDDQDLAGCANAAGMRLGLTLLCLARNSVTPRKGAAILAAARNDGPYLLEWVAYHLSVGFEHFFISSSGNNDGSDALLALLARHGIITHIRNATGTRLSAHEKAYAHALSSLPQILDYRWAALIDVDEYVGYDALMFGGIADFIALHEAQPVDAIALCWLLYGAPLSVPYQPGLTLERFTSRVRAVNTHVKSMIRPRAFCGSHIHFPYTVLEAPYIFRSQDGNFHHHPGVAGRIPAFAERPAAVQGWIARYAYRSAAETLWKATHGDVAVSALDGNAARDAYLDSVGHSYIENAASGDMLEDRRILACATGQPRMLEKLLALPGVAETNAQIRQDFEAGLHALAEAELYAPLPADATQAQRYFRAALAESMGVVHQTIFPTLTPMV